MNIVTTTAAVLIAAGVGIVPALADNEPDTDIVTATPEAQEDCEALRESLERQRDDNILNAADLRELEDKGC